MNRKLTYKSYLSTSQNNINYFSVRRIPKLSGERSQECTSHGLGVGEPRIPDCDWRNWQPHRLAWYVHHQAQRSQGRKDSWAGRNICQQKHWYGVIHEWHHHPLSIFYTMGFITVTTQFLTSMSHLWTTPVVFQRARGVKKPIIYLGVLFLKTDVFKFNAQQSRLVGTNRYYEVRCILFFL